MSWNEQHSLSEKFAIEADLAARAGDSRLAEELYRRAAQAEQAAFDGLSPDKQRTRGVTAVSATALTYKAREYLEAERLAYAYLLSDNLPRFAHEQLRDLLSLVWTARAAQRAGIRFVSGDVLVSVRGGQVIHGGAPLDLIIRKVEGIQSVLFRTVEMLLERPFRRRGGPSNEILSMFRPWLFQAPAGSYQFAVRVQEPEQQEMWDARRPRVQRVTRTFFDVLRASANDPDADLAAIVPDREYREAFLSLSRNLAPTGKAFEWLEVRDAATPSDPVASFGSEARQQINAALRKVKPPKAAATSDEPATIQGVLRGVHLDQDWLDLATTETPLRQLRIEEAGDVLDDVIGPMVNRLVVVNVLRRGTRLLYRDIEMQE